MFHVVCEVSLDFVNIPLVFKKVPLSFPDLTVFMSELWFLQFFRFKLSLWSSSGVAGLYVQLYLRHGIVLGEVGTEPPAPICAESADRSWTWNGWHLICVSED